MKEKEKTIYELDLHEALKITTNLGPIEITRVPGGWVYCFDYPGFRQSHIVFIPFNTEFTLNYTGPKLVKKKKSKKE